MGDVTQATDRKQFTTHFRCELNETDKRKITPWFLEKTVQQFTGAKPKSIRSIDKTAFIIEVHNEQQGMEMNKINLINNIDVKITYHENTRYNKAYFTSKSMIYQILKTLKVD